MVTSPRIGQQRTTQGFVHNLTYVRDNPSLTFLEVAWRWIFGIPAIALLYTQGVKVFASTPWQSTSIENLTVNQLLTDPLKASETLANFATIVGPGLYHAAAWIAPLLLVAWAVVSGIGRTLVLRRMEPQLHARIPTLIALQLLRTLPIAISATLWWIGLRALANIAILKPIAAGQDPAMMVYVGGAIILTLGLFVLTSASGWAFTIAPILAMLHNTGIVRSLRDGLRIGRLRGSLVEINLVLGIVKIALLVLAMVFSACPLPFQSVTTPEFLFWWNVAVAVWYFLASDFFHVARLSAYLHLWQSTHE